MTNRAIFLDVDGVLNNMAYFKVCTEADPLDPACIRRAVWLINRADAVVVLSSTWRHYPRLRQKVWAALGLSMDDYQATPDLAPRPRDPDCELVTRGHEIDAWLRQHPEITKYVILDDDGDMRPEQMPRLIRTTFDTGLTASNAKRALLLINPAAYEELLD